MRHGLRFALVSLLAVALVGWVGSSTAFAAAPANDNFSSATVISSLPFSDVGVDTTLATTEAGEPSGNCFHSGGSVWYSITPASDEVLRVDTNQTTDLNAVNIYSGTDINTLTFVGCNYSFTPVTVHASPGTTYYIQVAGVFSSPTFNIQVSVVPPPVNDAFANASIVNAVPFSSGFDPTGATLEAGEPAPSCAPFGAPNNSAWYDFTPSSSGSYTLATNSGGVPSVAVYTGATLGSLSEIACKSVGGYSTVSFAATQGVTYHIQIGDYYGGAFGPVSFSLDVAPAPTAFFYASPSDPSTVDVVQFIGQSTDYGGGNPIAQESFSFGDGSSAVGCCPQTVGDVDATHQYAQDGDYTVTVTATTTDGRTATYQQTIHVATHDVAISQLTVPMAAKAGQTKPIAVTVRNSRYPETVRVDLYESVGGGFTQVASLTQAVPAKGAQHPTSFAFNYTFTTNDAAAGKVVFQAVATIQGARDAFPADNTANSTAVKVSR
jgi:hypothetical protein